MKGTRCIRKVDNLGRIVIPRDIRKALDIKEWDDLQISLEKNSIVINRCSNHCTFCNSKEDQPLS